ncbi:MAG TPA: cupin domain-containing protein [Candidatus Kapabacteria bacterium]|nr:cupin domain-containing protein [Candidatus Kapabacteria bacterium]
MKIFKADDRTTMRGPKDWFTGTVWVDEIATPPAPARQRSARVSFEPGARTAWHTHPLGQVIHILSGIGRVQSAGEPVQTVRPGDTVMFSPGEKHWHGAAPQHAMVHLAMQEADDKGETVTWLEHVTDAEYNAVSS